MAFCRPCEVSWVIGERCWLCARLGEPGTFPKRWLSEDAGGSTDRHRWGTDWRRLWREYLNAGVAEEAS